MININIDEDTIYNLLADRVDVWRSGEEAELFKKMYENHIDSGCFEGSDFDPMVIVDNDVVNYCSIVSEGDPDFKKLLELYKNGDSDVSCESFEDGCYSFIEAVSDNETMILTRY